MRSGARLLGVLLCFGALLMADASLADSRNTSKPDKDKDHPSYVRPSTPPTVRPPQAASPPERAPSYVRPGAPPPPPSQATTPPSYVRPGTQSPATQATTPPTGASPSYVRPGTQPPAVQATTPPTGASPSYVRPGTQPPAVQATAPAGATPSYVRPLVRPSVAATPVAAAKVVIPPVTAAKQSEVDKRMSQGQSATALAAFQKDQGQFKALPVGAPTTHQAAVQSPIYQQYGSRWGGNPNNYYRDRDNYINSLPPQRADYWKHPPSYVVNARPSYGSFSGGFMGSLVGSAVGTGAALIIDHSYANWAAAHRNTPEYQQWHADMMAQAEASSDPDLRYRMAALDTAVDKTVSDGEPLDPNALPDGVDPSLAVASDTVLMATSSDEVSDSPDAPPQPQGDSVSQDQ